MREPAAAFQDFRAFVAIYHVARERGVALTSCGVNGLRLVMCKEGVGSALPRGDQPLDLRGQEDVVGIEQTHDVAVRQGQCHV
jgi:hypothetical protein